MKAKFINNVLNESMGYTDFFGKNISHEEALQKRIRDLITNIITEERGISEKAFSAYDSVIDEVKNICSKHPEIYDIANECYNQNKRLELAAEYVYSKYFKNNSKANESLFEEEFRKIRYFYDDELGVPYIQGNQVNFSGKREFIWPDGNKSIVDTFRTKLRKISSEEYEELVKRYFAHEKFMKDAYKDAKRLEKEELDESIINERSYDTTYENIKEKVKNSKNLPKEFKEKLYPLIVVGQTKYKDGGVVLDLKYDENKGCSLGADKNGFFVYTHRARSKSHPEIDKIPAKTIKFIESTG